MLNGKREIREREIQRGKKIILAGLQDVFVLMNTILSHLATPHLDTKIEVLQHNLLEDLLTSLVFGVMLFGTQDRVKSLESSTAISDTDIFCRKGSEKKGVEEKDSTHARAKKTRGRKKKTNWKKTHTHTHTHTQREEKKFKNQTIGPFQGIFRLGKV